MKVLKYAPIVMIVFACATSSPARAMRYDNDGRSYQEVSDRGVAQQRHYQVSSRRRIVARHISNDAAPKISVIGETPVVSEARRYIGGNPTGRGSLWCAAFMNLVLQRTGHSGSGSNMARSFASYGKRVSGPQVGAIAVMSRRGGGHVGVVSGVDSRGNVIVISGNHGHRVAESVYPRSRIYAYVLPST